MVTKRQFETRRELLAGSIFGGRSFESQLVRFEKGLSRLSRFQAEFIGEALWQRYEQLTAQKDPKPIPVNFRGRKKTLMDNSKGALADLEVIAAFFAGHGGPVGRWFSKEDLKEVFPKDRLAALISDLVLVLGTEYADRIIDSLRWAYARDGETIVIQRALTVGSGPAPIRPPQS